ncbi:MAG: SPOR domain-containing protein, partial [Desulfatiglandaceae bacterium]
MLISRLSKGDNIEVLNKREVAAVAKSRATSEANSETIAREIGNHLTADFVIFGSVTVLGNGVSVDTQMVDVAGGKPPMTFLEEGTDRGDIITIINRIAADVNDRLLAGTATAETSRVLSKEATNKASRPFRTGETDSAEHSENIHHSEGHTPPGKIENTERPGIGRRKTEDSTPSFGKSEGKSTVMKTAPATKGKAASGKPSQSNAASQKAVEPTLKTPVLAGRAKSGARTVRREDWLLSRDPADYTIQIMGAYNELYLLKFINEYQLLEHNEIAYYRSTFNNKPWYQLLYGTYPTKEDARLATLRLPGDIRNSDPWIRRMSGVQKAIRAREKRQITSGIKTLRIVKDFRPLGGALCYHKDGRGSIWPDPVLRHSLQTMRDRRQSGTAFFRHPLQPPFG